MQHTEALLEGIDPAPLDRLRRWGGAALAHSMAGAFLLHAPTRLEAASRQACAADGAGAELSFHQLKTICAQVGAERMYRICVTAERVAIERQLDRLPPLLAEMRAELERVRRWLESLREA